MSIKFGSEEATAVVAKDRLLEQIRAISGPRLEEIEKELEEINDEIDFFEMSLQELKDTRRALLNEKKSLEKGKP